MEYIPLTNSVLGPYRKLRNEFFPLRLMSQARIVGEKQGSLSYATDRESKVSKIFIISPLCLTRSHNQGWRPQARAISSIGVGAMIWDNFSIFRTTLFFFYKNVVFPAQA